jgi:hypothetical protein
VSIINKSAPSRRLFHRIKGQRAGRCPQRCCYPAQGPLRDR